MLPLFQYLKTLVSYVLSGFLVDYSGWISLILVIPFWPEVEIIYFLKFFCLRSTETDPQSSFCNVMLSVTLCPSTGCVLFTHNLH